MHSLQMCRWISRLFLKYLVSVVVIKLNRIYSNYLRYLTRREWVLLVLMNLRRCVRVWERGFLVHRLSRWYNMQTRIRTIVLILRNSRKWWPNNILQFDCSQYNYLHFIIFKSIIECSEHYGNSLCLLMNNRKKMLRLYSAELIENIMSSYTEKGLKGLPLPMISRRNSELIIGNIKLSIFRKEYDREKWVSKFRDVWCSKINI